MFWLSDVTTGTDTARSLRHYEVQARAARAGAVRRAFAGAGRGLLGLGAASRGLVARARDRRQRRRTVRDLHYLDDHLLADIGLTRGDVDLLHRGQWPTRYADGWQEPKTTVVAGTKDRPADGGDDQQDADWQRAA